ncbi:MAG: alpha-aminoadipate/glutamate carrier protein LysW/ArgW [Nitrososphaerales archaeon]
MVKKALCEECGNEIIIPDDSLVGEIITCSTCGIDYELVKVEESRVELKEAEAVGEDWGE